MAERTTNAPKGICRKLRELVRVCERGPSLIDPRTGKDMPDPGKLWRDTWVTPDLRALLAWADGVASVREVTERYPSSRVRDYRAGEEPDRG